MSRNQDSGYQAGDRIPGTAMEALMTHRPMLSDIGVPDGHQILSLGYHAPTRTVIAHTGPYTVGPRIGQLFFRWPSESTYQPVGCFPKGTSVESFVLDPLRPALYFLTYTWRGRADGGASGNWDALYRFDLEEHACVRLLGSEKLSAIS